MSSRDPLKQLRRPGRPSPNFHDQISDILSEGEYKQWVPNTRDDDVAGIVNDLDKVCRHVLLPHSPLKPS